MWEVKIYFLSWAVAEFVRFLNQIIKTYSPTEKYAEYVFFSTAKEEEL